MREGCSILLAANAQWKKNGADEKQPSASHNQDALESHSEPSLTHSKYVQTTTFNINPHLTHSSMNYSSTWVLYKHVNIVSLLISQKMWTAALERVKH